jgi:hypothetical protein
MSRNNAQFTLLKHLTPKGSIFDTKEPQIDLTLILPVYLGSLLPKLFSAYLAWLHGYSRYKGYYAAADRGGVGG